MSTLGSQELLAAHRRRLLQLEIQAAVFGFDTPAHITAEIRQIREAIAAIEAVAIPAEDAYSSYEVALEQLLPRLSQHERYTDALVFQQRLFENIAQTRLYGNTETRMAERAEIVARIGDLSLSVLGERFARTDR